MLRNFLKIAFRTLYKQRLFATFNILGISMGMACCIVVYLLIDHLYKQDAFHTNYRSIFIVNHIRTVNGYPERWTPTPAALGPALQKDIAQVKRMVRFHGVSAVVKSGNNVFPQYIHLADSGFFNVFTFPLQQGSSTILQDPSAIVLSHQMAQKYFGHEPAIGKPLIIIFEGKVKRTFTVRAVVAPFPNTASFSFDMLISYGISKDLGWQPGDWTQSVNATFIELHAPEAAEPVTLSLSKYAALHNQINHQSPIHSFYLDKLTDMSLHAHETRHAFSTGTSPTGMWVLTILASLVLLMACFNFMNYTIATSTNRFKEIGVRKVLGSSRKQLMGQFIVENLLSGGLAFLVALLLVDALFLPAFSRMIDFYTLHFQFTDNWQLIAFLLMLMGSISLLSGLYPSLYISGFNPVNVLKGKQQIKSTNGFTQTLLILQFGLSMFTVVAAIITTQNARFLRNMDVGYNQTGLMVLQANSEQSFKGLLQAASAHPKVVAVAGSQDQIGRTKDRRAVLEYETTKSAVELMHITAQYLDLLGIRLSEGRNFLPNSPVEEENAIIVNQALVRAMGWQQGVGKLVRVQNKSYQVVGVVKDFNYRFFFIKIAPCVLKLNAAADNRVVTIKTNSAEITSIAAYMKTHWQQLMPESPFELSRQEDVYSASYDESRRIKDVFTYVAVLSLLISAMGLYALVSLCIAKKTKEIGIRKILGASTWNVIYLVTREFLVVITLAGVLFLPLAYLLLKSLLDSEYAYHSPIQAGAFASTLLIMLMLTIISIGGRVLKVATSNPVKALRME